MPNTSIENLVRQDLYQRHAERHLLLGGEEVPIIPIDLFDLKGYLEEFWDQIGGGVEGPQMAVQNGRLPSSTLTPIGGGYFLRKDAAAAFLAMSAEAQRKYGTAIHVVAGYRTYARQVYFWNLWRAGRGNLAAHPGTSNHGWGLAIDLASQQMRHIVDAIGVKYGWAKRWSDAPSEWWHIKWDSSHVNVNITVVKTLRKGQTGPSIKTLQRQLRTLGFKSVPAAGKNGYGYFGASTVKVVKRIQKKHHLPVDGVVGPKTHAAIF